MYVPASNQNSNKSTYVQLLRTIFNPPCNLGNDVKSETIQRIINIVESNFRWLNIKSYRKNIEKILVKKEFGLNQQKVKGVWIQIHYNLTGNK